MLTLVKPTAVQAHLKSGDLVRLRQCVSGVLGRHPVYRRLALATDPAFERLAANEPLRSELRRQLERRGEIRYQLLAEAGFEHINYNDRTFGLLDPGTAGDPATYTEAEEAMHGLGPGEHRRIFLGTWGVVSPSEVGQLPPFMYSALITRLAKVAQDPGFERTTAIALTDAPNDLFKTNEDGSQTFVASLPQLAKETDLFRLNITTKKPGVFWRLWDWLLRRT